MGALWSISIEILVLIFFRFFRLRLKWLSYCISVPYRVRPSETNHRSALPFDIVNQKGFG